MSSLVGAKILTIDDEYVLRQGIVAYLEDSGFKVIEAENGERGLAVFREQKPDLVLTDLQMPVMNGIGVLSALSKEAPDVPVIVLSGAGGMSDVIEALRLGAWDYLTKPVADLAVLEHTVCKSLERARLISENKEYRAKLEKNLAILEADQEAGHSVQVRLLPEQGLVLGNYQFFHKVMPSLYLSGDFVDYFRISEHTIGFYVADVSGHGASSAFITILLKNIVSQMIGWYHSGKNNIVLEPNNLLSNLSSEIHTSQLGKYLTMVYGFLDEKTNIFTYSVGGHYPNPILLHNGQANFIPGKGFPVGIMKTVTYKNLTLEILPGATVMMFSDGIMEIVEADNMEEKERKLLQYVVETNGDFELLRDKLGIKDRKEFPDDITMLRVVRNA